MLTFQDHTYEPYKLVRLQPLGPGEDNGTAHRHKCLELFFFKEHALQHIIDFKSYPVEPLEVHLIRPNGLHHLQRNQQTYGYVLLISQAFFLQYAHHKERWERLNQQIVRFGPILKFEEPVFQLLQQQVELLFSLRDSPASPYKDEQICLHAEGILLSLLAAYHKTAASDNNFDSTEKLSCDFMALVEDHFHEWHDLSQYTKALNTGGTKLFQACRTTLNQAPIQLVHDRIILEAKRLLAHSDASVKEISWSLGYSDDAYFNRFFKKKTGTTAMFFRKNNAFSKT
jgi:AraC-like DNA-binding protein